MIFFLTIITAYHHWLWLLGWPRPHGPTWNFQKCTYHFYSMAAIKAFSLFVKDIFHSACHFPGEMDVPGMAIACSFLVYVCVLKYLLFSLPCPYFRFQCSDIPTRCRVKKAKWVFSHYNMKKTSSSQWCLLSSVQMNTVHAWSLFHTSQRDEIFSVCHAIAIKEDDLLCNNLNKLFKFPSQSDMYIS